jgi:hypothetical protein
VLGFSRNSYTRLSNALRIHRRHDARRLAHAERMMCVARSKGGSAKKTTRMISLSTAAEELANELIVLRTVTLDDSAKLASLSIRRLISVVNACSAFMRQHGNLFAAASAVTDVIEITGPPHGSPRRYDSAHRAAVGEAGHLLWGLSIHLDPAGQSESIKTFLAEAGIAIASGVACKNKPNTLASAGANKVGLSPLLVVERWSEAKAELLLRLSATWERDFQKIPAQINRERTQLRQTQQRREGM